MYAVILSPLDTRKRRKILMRYPQFDSKIEPTRPTRVKGVSRMRMRRKSDLIRSLLEHIEIRSS